MKRTLILLSALSFLMVSCSSIRKFKNAPKDLAACQKENTQLQKNLKTCNGIAEEAQQMVIRMKQEIVDLKKDTAYYGTELRNSRAESLANAQKMSDLSRNLTSESQSKDKELRSLLGDFQKNQEDLIRKEDELKGIKKKLDEREKNLKELSENLNDKKKRVLELEIILAEKDTAVNRLKRKVNAALVGFADKGLSIEIMNGKVYVSMEERLLFPSASWQVSKDGEDALKKLAKVLEDQPDINVQVEGHTDNVPYKGTGQVKDNWDLSVMRATSVTKILLEKGKIKPGRVSAAGRSEYVPLDSRNSKESRAKNRRTEIILTPKLDELFKVLENN